MSRSTGLTVLGWFTAAAFLTAGVPLFLRMPLWCDTTLYDVAAQVVLGGGVHYRDVFDTNPPGFVWLLCGVRVILGPTSEAVRVVDLAVAAGVVAFLLAWARRAGASAAGVAWAAAAAAALYPFSQEFNHGQRDVWMMPPVLAAAWLRVRRLASGDREVAGSEAAQPATSRSPLAGAFVEGVLWGVGCWVKPHVFVIAAGVWVLTAGQFNSTRRALLDLVAVVAGGLLAGLAGVAWLVGTGAWPHFLDVWRNWNTSYADLVLRELPFRLTIQLDYFPPYSVCALLAVPLAVANLRDRTADDSARFRRAALAGLYLAWLLSALLLQRGYHYVHVPETLLMLAVFAANRWPVPAALVLIQTVVGVCLLIADRDPALMNAHRQARRASWAFRQVATRNPAFDPGRTRWWPGCYDRDPPRELRKGVALFVDHFGGTDPVELGAVADYLRAEGVGDGELIAWHDSPHGLYLALGVRPGFRFMHVSTAAHLGPWQRERILDELRAAAPRARFAVSDMLRITEKSAELAEAGLDGLPGILPAWQRGEFPFDQPVVFRSPGGRYLVHRVVNPVRGCAIPEKLDQSEPNRAK